MLKTSVQIRLNSMFQDTMHNIRSDDHVGRTSDIGNFHPCPLKPCSKFLIGFVCCAVQCSAADKCHIRCIYLT
ncbi:hypothetical protein JHK85_046362 [Glycine max]|uniref:Uncharacterized protein n=1 Tax=Glycine max TaxID=3847 RepID=K7MI41_SOYBN|nr:hypothetical protein JHK85_046362 [Glycine max]KAH1151929.1 hypothetical protein GYH30_045432 [Glycine max]